MTATGELSYWLSNSVVTGCISVMLVTSLVLVFLCILLVRRRFSTPREVNAKTPSSEKEIATQRHGQQLYCDQSKSFIAAADISRQEVYSYATFR